MATLIAPGFTVTDVALSKRALLSLALNVSSTALVFLGTLILARLLGDRGYGVYASVIALMNLLAVPVVLGFDRLVTRNLAAHARRDGTWAPVAGLLRRSTQFVVVASAVAGFSCALLLGAASGAEGEALVALWLGLLAVPFLGLARVRQGTLAGLNSVIAGQIPETVIRPALIAILSVGAGWALGAAFRPPAALAVNLVATIVAFVIGTTLLIRRLPPDLRAAQPTYHTRRWIGEAVQMGLVSGIVVTMAQVDMLALSAIRGPDAAGPYAIASRVASLIIFGLLAVNIPLGPGLARMWADGDRQSMQRLLTRGARLALLVAAPMCLLLIVAGSAFLGLFGEDFTSAAPALAILAVGQLLHVSGGPAGILLLMTGRHRAAVLAAAAGLATNLILSPLLIARLGMEGAALASAISFAVWSGLAAVYAIRVMHFDPTAVGRLGANH